MNRTGRKTISEQTSEADLLKVVGDYDVIASFLDSSDWLIFTIFTYWVNKIFAWVTLTTCPSSFLALWATSWGTGRQKTMISMNDQLWVASDSAAWGMSWHDLWVNEWFSREMPELILNTRWVSWLWIDDPSTMRWRECSLHPNWCFTKTLSESLLLSQKRTELQHTDMILRKSLTWVLTATCWCTFDRTAWLDKLDLPWHTWLRWASRRLRNTCEPETNENLWAGWALEDADLEWQSLWMSEFKVLWPSWDA